MSSNTVASKKRKIVVEATAFCPNCHELFSADVKIENNRVVSTEEHPHIFSRYSRPHHHCCRNGKGYLIFYF